MQKDKLLWGSILILLGVIFLGGNIWGFNAFETVWKVFPLVLVVFGVWIYMLHPHSIVLSILLVLVGLLMFLGNMEIIDINLFSLWPLFLVGLGLNVLLQKNEDDNVTEDTENLIDTTMFAGSKRIVTSNKFRSAKITTVLGENELDLSQVKSKEEIVIEAVVVMGSMKLRVPNNAEVINKVSKIGSEVKDRRSEYQKSSEAKTRVVVKGVVTLSSLEIS